jgi:exopolyphosphatase / guanosine-5'-triphosphate,3'-diphosphate pyrophosphatase
MTRVAAIDCGTNSLRLLVADIAREGAPPGELTDVVRTMEIVRLGQGVDRTGRLAADALGRTFTVLRRYAGLIAERGVTATRMIATSATRGAANAGEFAAGVRDVLGIEPEVISGEEEAALSFAGATLELDRTGPAGPYLVVDIGGGSTEFVLGDGYHGAAGGVAAPVSVSVDIGCVRMTERHLHTDPPAAGEIAAATSDIETALDIVALKMPAASAATLVGLAGSVTTVAGIALGLREYDPRAIHHSRIPAAQVRAVSRALLGQSHTQRSEIGVMHPGRVDVIGAGALILDRVMARFGFSEVVVSEHDILDGIAWQLGHGLP